MACLDEDTVLAFVDGGLEPTRRLEAETHLADCSACAAWVATAAGASAPADALSGPDEPAPSNSDPELAPGTTVGRYVVLGLVGRGGMGEVYAAYDPQLDRRVALKLLHERHAVGESAGPARDRLLREAKAIARLHHPNVVAVHDAGATSEPARGQRVFVAMEFVEGETLAGWLSAKARSWRAIRDVFAAAGEGLAAAHEAGLVHRDFKPQNVMVARDGSVRVMDFGLATDAGAVTEGPAEVQTPSGADDVAKTLALTRTGALLGTPLYMSPEQMLGQQTDARTDQFSFCVALYEALYKDRPFASESFLARFAAVVAGEVREPNDKGVVPSFLRRLVMRGLAVAPAHRYPTMRALLEELRHDPTRRRRRALLGVAIGAVTVAAVFAGQRLATRGERMCGGASERLAGIWEMSDGPPENAGSAAGAARRASQGERRTAIHRAFAGTGRSFAEETWTKVATVLDDYARRWTTVYADNCEATHVRGDQSAQVMDMRMSCLDDARGAFKALGDVLSRADGAVVVEAVKAAHGLPALERCSNVADLRAEVAPPSDPTARARVAAARQRLAEIKALTDTGQWRAAKEKSGPLVAEARTVGYDPLLAECLAAHGWLTWQVGGPEEAAGLLEQAVWTSIGGHRDDVALDSTALLLGIIGYFLGRTEEAQRWEPLGYALMRRLGSGHERSASWFYQGVAATNERAGAYTQALADLQRALSLKELALPPLHPDLAETLATITNVENQIGDHRAALAAADRAVSIYAKAYGEGSPMLARPLGNRGETLEMLGRHAEAERDLRRAVELAAAWVGPDHPWAAYSMTALGKTLIAEGRPQEAAMVLEKALHIRERSEPNKELLAETRFALAQARWQEGRDRSGARALGESALAIYRDLPTHSKEASEVESWLVTRRAGQPVKARSSEP